MDLGSASGAKKILTSRHDDPDEIHPDVIHPEVKRLWTAVRYAFDVVVVQASGIIQDIAVQMGHAYNDAQRMLQRVVDGGQVRH